MFERHAPVLVMRVLSWPTEVEVSRTQAAAPSSSAPADFATAGSAHIPGTGDLQRLPELQEPP